MCRVPVSRGCLHIALHRNKPPTLLCPTPSAMPHLLSHAPPPTFSSHRCYDQYSHSASQTVLYTAVSPSDRYHCMIDMHTNEVICILTYFHFSNFSVFFFLTKLYIGLSKLPIQLSGITKSYSFFQFSNKSFFIVIHMKKEVSQNLNLQAYTWPSF